MLLSISADQIPAKVKQSNQQSRVNTEEGLTVAISIHIPPSIHTNVCFHTSTNKDTVYIKPETSFSYQI